jgi:hypothetical protein
MTLRSTVPSLATAIALVSAAPAGPAVAAPTATTTTVVATCGQVLTTDARLDRDLICPAGDGLILTGDLTLDLDGHRLVGPGHTLGTAVSVPGPWSVTIVDGTIESWALGTSTVADWSDRSDIVVRDVMYRGTGTGINAMNAAVDVASSRFVDNGGGITAFQAMFTVSGSTFEGNGTAAHAGAGGLDLSRVRMVDNHTAASCSDGGCWMDRVYLRGNQVGLTVDLSGGTITRSTFSDNEVGATLGFGTNLTIERNTLRDNHIAISSGSHNHSTVRDNRFVGNATAITNQVDDPDAAGSPIFERNTLLRNGDAIRLRVTGARLGDNLAVGNTGWGIFAEDAIDLGGNRAWRNGTDPQCVGVVCP